MIINNLKKYYSNNNQKLINLALLKKSSELEKNDFLRIMIMTKMLFNYIKNIFSLSISFDYSVIFSS